MPPAPLTQHNTTFQTTELRTLQKPHTIKLHATNPLTQHNLPHKRTPNAAKPVHYKNICHQPSYTTQAFTQKNPERCKTPELQNPMPQHPPLTHHKTTFHTTEPRTLQNPHIIKPQATTPLHSATFHTTEPLRCKTSHTIKNPSPETHLHSTNFHTTEPSRCKTPHKTPVQKPTYTAQPFTQQSPHAAKPRTLQNPYPETHLHSTTFHTTEPSRCKTLTLKLHT